MCIFLRVKKRCVHKYGLHLFLLILEIVEVCAESLRNQKASWPDGQWLDVLSEI